jgi:hypothetical protein
MAASATATSPSDGGGLKVLKWSEDPDVKGQWVAPDGADRPPSRIKMTTQGWLGKSANKYFVYRNGEYLGSVEDLDKAKKLAAAGVRTFTSLRDTVDGSEDGLPAFAALTQQERKMSREKYWNNRYGDDLKLKPKREPYMAKYESMTPEQLATAYNYLVDEARSKGLDRFRQIPRFKDKDEGLKYIEAIESSIRARAASEKAAKAEGSRKRANEPTPQEVTKETEEMATKNGAKNGAKKKAAKKSAKKAATPKKAAVERPAGKAGEFTGKINTRPGSATDKLALHLFANLGKMVPLAKVPEAQRLADLRNKIAEAKASYHIKRDREKNAIGLYTGSEK